MTKKKESKEMELGLDPSELYAVTIEKELVIVHNDKRWVFKYRDMTWKEKYDCVDAAQTWQGTEFSFSLGRYYVNALTKMLVDSPIKPLTETTISKLDTKVGSQLLSIVPPPAEIDEAESLKKE